MMKKIYYYIVCICVASSCTTKHTTGLTPFTKKLAQLYIQENQSYLSNQKTQDIVLYSYSNYKYDNLWIFFSRKNIYIDDVIKITSKTKSGETTYKRYRVFYVEETPSIFGKANKKFVDKHIKDGEWLFKDGDWIYDPEIWSLPFDRTTHKLDTAKFLKEHDYFSDELKQSIIDLCNKYY